VRAAQRGEQVPRQARVRLLKGACECHSVIRLLASSNEKTGPAGHQQAVFV
jgi:hypothetical protein